MEIIEKEVVKKIKYLNIGGIQRPLDQVKDLLEDIFDNIVYVIEDIQLRDALVEENIIEIVDQISGTCKIGERYYSFLNNIGEENHEAE
jgi:hypothetical protein